MCGTNNSRVPSLGSACRLRVGGAEAGTNTICSKLDGNQNDHSMYLLS